MTTKTIWVLALGAAGLAAGSSLVGCSEGSPSSGITPAEVAAAEKAAAEEAVADRLAADAAAADEAAARAAAEESALPLDLVQTKAEVTRALAQLDLTMARLEAVATSEGDLDGPSEKALDAIEDLASEIQLLRKRGDQMRDRGADYFAAWEEQLAAMSTPAVLEVAQKRKDELAAKYAQVLTAMQECRSALDAFWPDMKRIREALEDGPTSETQAALAARVATAETGAATLKARLQAAAAMLDQVSLVYAPR